MSQNLLAEPPASGDPESDEIAQLRLDLHAFIKDLRKRKDRASFATRAWQALDYILGLPAAVLATISGTTGLASTTGRVPAAVMALIAAGLTAVTSFLHSNDNHSRSRERRNAYLSLESDTRLELAHAGRLDAQALSAVLKQLYHRRDTILARGFDPPATSAAVTPAHNTSP